MSAIGVGDALLAIGHAGERLAQAVAKEMRLADERALIKDAAIVRIIESGQERSATAAEKVVEKDEQYMEHRRAQYEAVKERIRAQAEYDSAVVGARLTCELGEALGAAPAIEPAGDLRHFSR